MTKLMSKTLFLKFKPNARQAAGNWMLRSEETVSMTEDGLAFQQLESSYVTERYYLPAFLLVT